MINNFETEFENAILCPQYIGKKKINAYVQKLNNIIN